MATGDEVKVNKSFLKNRIWKLWNGLELIRINRCAGEDMATGEKIKINRSL